MTVTKQYVRLILNHMSMEDKSKEIFETASENKFLNLLDSAITNPKKNDKLVILFGKFKWDLIEWVAETFLKAGIGFTTDIPKDLGIKVDRVVCEADDDEE